MPLTLEVLADLRRLDDEGLVEALSRRLDSRYDILSDLLAELRRQAPDLYDRWLQSVGLNFR